MAEAVLFLLGGLVALYFGGDWLISGGSRLSLRFGVSPLIIGLTVVALGTSSPELAVSLRAALAGTTEIAVGNVVGSNICNIALILGIAAIVRPIKTQGRLLRHDLPIMLLCSLAMFPLLLDGRIGRWEGVALVVALVAYIGFNLWDAKRESKAVRDEYYEAIGSRLPRVGLSVLLIAGGLIALALGARWFVDGAVAGGQMLGLSPTFIALTIVAVGTSLPELAASAVASARGQGDIAVGNIVGSNIFNVLAVLGMTSLVAPLSAGGVTWADLGVMITLSGVLLVLVITGMRLSRIEGWLLLAAYFGYIGWRATAG